MTQFIVSQVGRSFFCGVFFFRCRCNDHLSPARLRFAYIFLFYMVFHIKCIKFSGWMVSDCKNISFLTWTLTSFLQHNLCLSWHFVINSVGLVRCNRCRQPVSFLAQYKCFIKLFLLHLHQFNAIFNVHLNTI